MSISASFEGSGGITFNLPQTVNVIIRSGVGGTTDPAGVIRVTKGATLTVTCTPSAGNEAKSYTLNGGAAITITANTFTTATLAADATIEVTFGAVST